jgi:hypothetical protein
LQPRDCGFATVWQRCGMALARHRLRPQRVAAYRVRGLHFVEDGHHRVSIAAAMHQKTIDAYVTEIVTGEPARA